jgi:hypothetical protein
MPRSSFRQAVNWSMSSERWPAFCRWRAETDDAELEDRKTRLAELGQVAQRAVSLLFRGSEVRSQPAL